MYTTICPMRLTFEKIPPSSLCATTAAAAGAVGAGMMDNDSSGYG
jgi:hypothetical protein